MSPKQLGYFKTKCQMTDMKSQNSMTFNLLGTKLKFSERVIHDTIVSEVEATT